MLLPVLSTFRISIFLTFADLEIRVFFPTCPNSSEKFPCKLKLYLFKNLRLHLFSEVNSVYEIFPFLNWAVFYLMKKQFWIFALLPKYSAAFKAKPLFLFFLFDTIADLNVKIDLNIGEQMSYSTVFSGWRRSI